MDACELHVRPLEAIWEEDLVSEAVVTIVSAVNDSIVGRGDGVESGHVAGCGGEQDVRAEMRTLFRAYALILLVFRHPRLHAGALVSGDEVGFPWSATFAASFVCTARR